MDNIKKLLGERSASLVQDGMIVGLGTGSTARFFIESLIQRCREGLKIEAVASSDASARLAKKGDIPLLDTFGTIDITVDGADEVDEKNRLIKGRGGALLKEKILASASKKMVVIVEESKLVKMLGKAHLPIEILPFGYLATIEKIEEKGYKGTLRKDLNQTYLTDSGNYIFDIHTPSFFSHPEKDEEVLINIPGVIETGFFFDLATDILVGYMNGEIKWIRN